MEFPGGFSVRRSMACDHCRAIDLWDVLHYTHTNFPDAQEEPMGRSLEQENQSGGRSRVFSSVLSLIFPGLGQIVRGRIIAGLLFTSNVALYFTPLLVSQNAEYDIQTPSLLIAVGVWICSAFDAFLYKSSFLVLALLVSLFCFGSGFFGAYFLLPHLDV